MPLATSTVRARAGKFRTKRDIESMQRASGEKVTVKEYTKADGTVVPEHERAGGDAQQENPMLMNLRTARIAADPAVASKEPQTVKGYLQMFNKVPVSQWGGGDVSISVGMPDGRRVWLYGDTMSEKNGFVHSTALVQKNGKLTVSGGGKQVLPDGGKTAEGRNLIYWIEKARPVGRNKIEITAAPTSIGPGGPWDFKREGGEGSPSRVAVCKVDAKGNVVFQKWKGTTPRPVSTTDGEDVIQEGPNHYTYATVIHDIKLKNGKYLKTRAQNWDDPLENHIGPNGFKFHDYRPLFSEATAAERLAWKRANW